MTVLSKNPRAIHDACKEAVVDSVLNNLSARLAGRDEFYKIIYKGKPSSVLMSEFIVPMPPDERAGDEEANPIQISAHGLDFQILRSGADERMKVEIRGAVYVRILPTEDEVKPGGPLDPKFPLTKEASRELRSRIKDALAALRTELGITKTVRVHPDWSARSEEARRKAHESLSIPFDNKLDRSSTDESGEGDESTDPPEMDDGSGTPSEAPPEREARAGTTLPDALAKAIEPPPKWLRLDLDLPSFEFSPATCTEDSANASRVLNEAIALQIDRWATSEEEPYGGKLWGYRHGAPIRPSNTRDWKAYLASVRASALRVVVPALDLRWDIEALPDPRDPSRMTVHVALENWSVPNTALNRKEVEPSLFQLQVSLSLTAAVHRPLRLDRVKPSYRYNQYLKYPALGFNGGVSA